MRWFSNWFACVLHSRSRPTRLFADAGGDPLDFGDGVFVEFFQAAAEVVQSRLAVRSADDSILRTFAPAIGEIGTPVAILRQGLAFGATKFFLNAGENHVAELVVLDVSQPIFWIDIVIAGVEAAVIFHRHAFAAVLGIDTHLRRQSQVLRDERLKVIDRDPAAILVEPE